VAAVSTSAAAVKRQKMVEEEEQLQGMKKMAREDVVAAGDC
jgi:hypothetical protein